MLDLSAYPPDVAELLAVRPLAPLGPGVPELGVRDRLAAFDDAAFGRVVDRDMAAACRAGLWLAFNFIDDSHRISQDIDTREGSYWHAVMHRREPDAANSKYWWHRVGEHPVFGQLRDCVPTVGYTLTTPEAFVDFCERVRETGSEEERIAIRVQQLEWDLLFAWCYDRAVR